MIDSLDALDKQAMIYLNGLHVDWLDPIMWQISASPTWVPLYMVLIYLMARTQFEADLKNWKQWGLLVLGIALTIALADQISSGFFKPFFARLRPSHQPELDGLMHLLSDKNGNIYKGGMYGFVSSHAANSFAIAVFGSQLIQKKWAVYFLFIWAAVVSYSRIYLGVHYPGDILGGTVIGLLSGWIAVKVYFYSQQKLKLT